MLKPNLESLKEPHPWCGTAAPAHLYFLQVASVVRPVCPLWSGERSKQQWDSDKSKQHSKNLFHIHTNQAKKGVAEKYS